METPLVLQQSVQWIVIDGSEGAEQLTSEVMAGGGGAGGEGGDGDGDGGGGKDGGGGAEGGDDGGGTEGGDGGSWSTTNDSYRSYRDEGTALDGFFAA